jgi:TonB family protein
MAGLVGYSLLTGVALKSVGLLGGMWLLAWSFRRWPAAARHLIWTGAFAALIALPLLSLFLPAWRTPLSHTVFPDAALFRTGSAPLATVVQPVHGQAPARPLQTVPQPPDWRAILLLFWAAGATVSLTQIAVASAIMMRVRRQATRLKEPQLVALRQALGITYDVEVLETGPRTMPMATGSLKPAVLLPAEAAEWSEERRRVVLLHELAHLRRGDVGTNLLARLALSLYWWNPLAWKAWRALLNERERAADDLVLRTGARASEYAGHLLSIARTMSTPQPMADAVVAMARSSDLEGRLAAILDSARRRSSAGRGSAWLAILLAVVMVAPIAALSGQDAKPPVLPADIDAAITAATAHKDFDQLDEAASAAMSLRQWAVAQRLLEASLSIREAKSGLQSVDHGVGLSQLGDLERKQGLKTALAWYTKAEAVLGDQPQAANALTYLGIAAIGDKKYDHAMKYLQRAETAASSIHPTAEPLVWMAIALERKGMVDQADAMFKKAIWQEHGYPNLTDQTTDQELYADFLKRQHRDTELASLTTQVQAEQKSFREQNTVAPSPGVYRLDKSMQPPKMESKATPTYTEEARIARYQGTLLLSIEIGIDGVAHNVHIIQGLGLGLNAKALDAVAQWRFQPAMKDGQPVPVFAMSAVDFRLL